jgi:hypothetical protein
MLLRQIIVDLARGFSQPVFLPHLTLWSGTCRPNQAIEWMNGRANNLPLRVSLAAPTFGESNTQCVFVPIQPNEELRVLHQRSQQALGTSKQRRPHLSLLYGEPSVARRRDVSSTLQLPFVELQLTEFALVQASDQVEEWKILHRVTSLRGNA